MKTKSQINTELKDLFASLEYDQLSENALSDDMLDSMNKFDVMIEGIHQLSNDLDTEGKFSNGPMLALMQSWWELKALIQKREENTETIRTYAISGTLPEEN